MKLATIILMFFSLNAHAKTAVYQEALDALSANPALETGAHEMGYATNEDAALAFENAANEIKESEGAAGFKWSLGTLALCGGASMEMIQGDGSFDCITFTKHYRIEIKSAGLLGHLAGSVSAIYFRAAARNLGQFCYKGMSGGAGGGVYGEAQALMEVSCDSNKKLGAVPGFFVAVGLGIGVGLDLSGLSVTVKESY